jgi:CBS domain containing-hemolysin-like protein
VVELLGRIPDAGEVVDVEGLSVAISAVDEARIVELRFLAVGREETEKHG